MELVGKEEAIFVQKELKGFAVFKANGVKAIQLLPGEGVDSGKAIFSQRNKQQ